MGVKIGPGSRIETKKDPLLETLEVLESLKNELNKIINEIELEKVLHKGNSSFYSMFRFQDFIARAIGICVHAEKLACICAQDYENRLKQLEKQMEELKKRLPLVDDGK